MFAQSIAALSLLALGVNAIVTPTSPDGNTVVKAGDKIEALWTADQTSAWNNVQIQLMTGDNLQMVPLATVANGIDGTTATSYSFDAPEVEPYSKIYFLQFTNGGDMTNATWTTRFTIADKDGQTSEPTNSTVYSGAAVQWGTGKLLSALGTDSGSGAGASSNGSATSAGASVSTISVQSSTPSASASDSASASSTSAESASEPSASASASTTRPASAAANAASASSTGANSAAGKLEAGVGLAIMAGVAAYALL